MISLQLLELLFSKLVEYRPEHIAGEVGVEGVRVALAALRPVVKVVLPLPTRHVHVQRRLGTRTQPLEIWRY